MVTYVGTVIAFLVALFALVYVITNVFKIVPVQFTQIVNAMIVAVVIYIIIKIMARFLERFLSKYMDKNKYHTISFLFSVLRVVSSTHRFTLPTEPSMADNLESRPLLTSLNLMVLGISNLAFTCSVIWLTMMEA